MFKSPRRNGRNKGFKIKHVIQISMLVGVSIWLLYQIHHSDDKEPSVTTKISQKLEKDSSKAISKFGRKFLRPKVQNNENEESFVEDRESEEHEEVGEISDSGGKEDGEEMKEHENEKDDDDDDKGHEQTGKIQMKQDGNESDNQNQVVVMEDTEKKMKNNGENGSNKPSVDHNEHKLKDQTAQQIDSAPDSYSYETNTASYMRSAGDDDNMKADGEAEQKDDVAILEEEKDALTDLETLPESGNGGSITLDSAATA